MSDAPRFNPFQARQMSPSAIFRIDRKAVSQTTSVVQPTSTDLIKTNPVTNATGKMKLQTINIKKDALWKPLLRLFRRFVKRLSQNQVSSPQAQPVKESPSEAKQSNEESKENSECGSDYLYPSCEEGVSRSLTLILTNAYKIFDSLGIDNSLRSDRNALAVFLLVQSQKVTRKRSLIPVYKSALKNFSPEVI